ncbi:MAG: HTH-type transcriptional repressor FabR [Gammaproteobacteria bacterium]
MTVATKVIGKKKRAVSAQDVMDAAVGLLDSNRSVSTLTLREIARAAGIAPNSFYRHFRDVDELTVAVIDQAGRKLRGVIRESRLLAGRKHDVIRSSVETFMKQLDGEDKYLHVLLRELSTGPETFHRAVDSELNHFEDELRDEFERRQQTEKVAIHKPELVAKAITRLVFTMGASAADLPSDKRSEIVEQTIVMIRMIVVGAHRMGIKQLRAD